MMSGVMYANQAVAPALGSAWLACSHCTSCGPPCCNTTPPLSHDSQVMAGCLVCTCTCSCCTACSTPASQAIATPVAVSHAMLEPQSPHYAEDICVRAVQCLQRAPAAAMEVPSGHCAHLAQLPQRAALDL